MKPVLFSNRCVFQALCASLLIVVSSVATGEEEEEESFGWAPLPAPVPWQEQGSEIPAYPVEKNLLSVDAGSDSLQYRVFVDKLSLTRSDDGVVRYTVVLISSSGIWNVSHEGLHCGERQYRRYAFGIDGVWHPLDAEPWSIIRGNGANRYRKVFYDRYVCITARGYRSVGEILESFNDPWDERM